MEIGAFNGPAWTHPVFFVAVAFVLFFALFGAKLWAVMVGMLDGHAERIKRELSEAAQLRREAEAMLAEARSERELALAQAQRTLEFAKDEAARVAEAASLDATAAIKRREQMATDRINAAELAAIRDVRAAAAEVAAISAERLISQDLTPEADAGLLDRAIAGLPAAFATQRAA